jgi:hypothetical protein
MEPLSDDEKVLPLDELLKKKWAEININKVEAKRLQDESQLLHKKNAKIISKLQCYAKDKFHYSAKEFSILWNNTTSNSQHYII